MYVRNDVTTWRREIPIMEVTGRKDVQNGGRSIWKNDHEFGLFASLSKGKIHFFLLFTTNLSYFSSFKLPYKVQLPAFRSPLTYQAHRALFCLLLL